MVALMVHCGLRIGEVSSLQYDDLDLQAQVLVVTGKGGHQRALPVPDEAVQLLRIYFGEAPPRGGEPVFRRHDLPGVGLRPNSVGTEVGRLMRRAGLKGSAYDGVSATHCGEPAPATCSTRAPTFGTCSRCSVTQASPPRSCTCGQLRLTSCAAWSRRSYLAS